MRLLLFGLLLSVLEELDLSLLTLVVVKGLVGDGAASAGDLLNAIDLRALRSSLNGFTGSFRHFLERHGFLRGVDLPVRGHGGFTVRLAGLGKFDFVDGCLAIFLAIDCLDRRGACGFVSKAPRG